MDKIVESLVKKGYSKKDLIRLQSLLEKFDKIAVVGETNSGRDTLIENLNDGEKRYIKVHHKTIEGAKIKLKEDGVAVDNIGFVHIQIVDNKPILGFD